MTGDAAQRQAIEDEFDGCLGQGTVIHTDRGRIPVEDVRVGDNILTHSGVYAHVVKTHQRISDHYYQLQVSGYSTPFRITGEHPLPIFRREGQCRKPSLKSNASLVWEWTPVSKIERQDYVLIPKRKKLRPAVLSDEQMWVLGVFAAEGHYLKYKYKGNVALRGIVFSLGNKEAEYIVPKLASVLSNWSSAKLVLHQREDRGYVEVKLKDRDLAKNFFGWVGEYAHRKSLSPEIEFAENAIQLAIGFTAGDAHARPNRNDVTLSTASEMLAWQLRQILIDHGVWNTIRKQRRKTLHYLDAWVINIRGKYVGLLSQCWRVEPVNMPSSNHVWETEDGFFAAIKKIEYHEKPIEVFNLTVDGDHSYVAHGIAMHNCHDFLPSFRGACRTELFRGAHPESIARKLPQLREMVWSQL